MCVRVKVTFLFSPCLFFSFSFLSLSLLRAIHMHLTRFRPRLACFARIQEEGHSARIVRTQQLTNQNVNFCSPGTLDICLGRSGLKVCLHQTNPRTSPTIQPLRRHLSSLPPRMRRRQFRANLRYRTTLSGLQPSTLRWPNHVETHAFPTQRLFQVSDALPLPSGKQGLLCTTHEEISDCLPFES